MQITTEGRRITLTQGHGTSSVVAGAMLMLGLTATSSALVLARVGMWRAPWLSGGVAGLGLLAVAMGTWMLWHTPRSDVVLDLASGRGRVQQRGFAQIQTTEFPLEGIASVELERGTDAKGGDVFRPALRMHDGERLILSPVWMHDGAQDAVRTLARALDRPTTSRR